MQCREERFPSLTARGPGGGTSAILFGGADWPCWTAKYRGHVTVGHFAARTAFSSLSFSNFLPRCIVRVSLARVPGDVGGGGAHI